MPEGSRIRNDERKNEIQEGCKKDGNPERMYEGKKKKQMISKASIT